MRKILPLLLVLVLLMTLSPLTAAAAGGAQVQVTYPSGTAVGGTFTVTVACTENPGISGVQMALAYDPAVLQCTSVKTGTVLSGMMSVTNPSASDGARVVAAAATDKTGTGTMCTFTFKVLAEGDYGLALDNLILLDSSGDDVAATVTEAGGSSSTAPETPETSGTPEAPTDESAVLPTYTDTIGHWAEAEIMKASKAGLVNGMGNNRYSPDATMTRAQFATILWRYSGSPEPKGTSTYVDLEPNMTYYHKAVAWAEENGIMNGMGNFRFDPSGSVTREQLVTVLHRMAGSPTGMELMFAGMYDTGFTDSGKIGDWAKAAMYWSIYNEIYCGRNSTEVGTTLYPKEPANRAQIAVMMARYLTYMEE